MKLRCKKNSIVPPIDSLANVAWLILSQNMISQTVFYGVIAILHVQWLLIGLRFTLLEANYISLFLKWGLIVQISDHDNGQSASNMNSTTKSVNDKISQQEIRYYQNFASESFQGLCFTSCICILCWQIFAFLVLIYVYRKMRTFNQGSQNQSNKYGTRNSGNFNHSNIHHHSTFMQLLLRYLIFEFLICVKVLQPVYLVACIVPLTRIQKFSDTNFNIQIALSTLILTLNSIKVLIFQKFFNLRSLNTKIPWAMPNYYYDYLEYLFGLLLIAFFTLFDEESSGRNLLPLILQTLLFVINLIKVVMQFQVPYFLNPNLALFQINMDTIVTSYFLSAIMVRLIEFNYVKDSHNSVNVYIMMQIMTLLVMIFLVNYIKIRKQESLINKILTDNVKSPFECQQGIILLLQMIHSKDGYLQNKLDGICLNYELDYYYDQKAFSKNLERQFDLQLLAQLETRPFKIQNSKNIDLLQNSNKIENNSFYLYFQSTYANLPSAIDQQQFASSNINETGVLVQESSYHTLAECFNNEKVKQSRIQELEFEQQERRNEYEKLRDLRDNVTQIQTSFLAHKILSIHFKKFPDNIPLLFLKCYLSLIHLKNRFICLTSITQIENMNKKMRYFDQVENKIQQLYFLEICQQEQSKASDQADSDVFLDLNITINDYTDLLTEASQSIYDFWQILGSESNHQQVLELEKVQLKISDLLRRIKQQLKYIEVETPLLQFSSIVYYYTAIFYQMSLRDIHLSEYFFKQIAVQTQILQVVNRSKLQNFDDVSMAIVDGDFAKMGSILYGNKILLRALGYRIEEVYMKTVHILMPKEIAFVHDRFWNRFKESGVPHVLEQERFLFIKNKQKYVNPFKIFIKFIYHQKYGYTFLGLFRLPRSIIMNEVDKPIKLKNVCMFIANNQMRVTEISENCEILMGLNQKLFESLTQFLEEGLCSHHFNSNFTLTDLDFSKGTCIIINKCTFDTSILTKHSKELELKEDENSNQKCKIGKNLAQIKIVKEIYGHDDVCIYYFMIVFIKDIFSMPAIEGESDSNKKLLLSQSENSRHHNFQNLSFSESISVHDGETGSLNREASSALGSMSQSSCTSNSSGSGSFDELKYLEENIDYSRSPKSLILVKIIYNLIIGLMVFLTTSLIIVNQIQILKQIKEVSIIQNANQNMLTLSQVQLFTRNFINIDLGLEPNKNVYFLDRRSLIQNESFDVLESMRLRMNSLSFLNNNEYAGYRKTISINDYSFKSGNRSTSLESNFAIQSFIVKATELFKYDKVNSKVMTYLSNANDTQKNTDHTAFYVLNNLQKDLKTFIKELPDYLEFYILDQNTYFKDLNKIFLVVVSCTIFLGVLTALFFYSKIIETQTITLTFFSEITKDQIEYCMRGAADFYAYLQTDNDQIISNDTNLVAARRLQLKALQVQEREWKREQVKQQDRSNNRGEYQRQQTTYPNHLETQDLMAVDRKGKVQSIDLEEFKESTNIPSLVNNNMNSKVVKINDFSSSLNQLRSQKNKLRQIDEDFNQKQSKSSAEKSKKRNRMNNKKGKSIKQRSVSDNDENQLSLDDTNQPEKPQDNGLVLNDSLSHILMQWKLKKIALVSMYFLFLAVVFVSYFVVQYLIVEKINSKMTDHIKHLQQVYKSQACINWFIADLREMQITNSTYSKDYMSQSQNQCANETLMLNTWIIREVYNEDIKNLFTRLNTQRNLCQVIKEEYPMQEIDIESCNKIYSGVMEKPFFQIGNQFLFDTFQKALKFEGRPKFNSSMDTKFLNDTVADPQMIEMIDAQQFFISKANELLAYTVNKAYLTEENLLGQEQLYIFLVYICILFACLIGLNCFVFVQMRKQMWNSKIIFKLLPIEELQPELKRRIQIFLFKS